MVDELRTNDVLVKVSGSTVTLQPLTENKAIRVKLLGSGKGETEQGLMVWLEMNMQKEEWKETLVISAWNDNKICGPHYEIASCSNKGAGGVTRPISFWMNEENPQKHVEMLRIAPDGVYGKVFKFMNGFSLMETADGKGVQLVKPDGSVAKEWR
jgi:hypothetical protein